MEERRLADLEHANMLATFAACARSSPDGILRRERGIFLMSLPVPIRLFNEVLIEGPDADPAALADGVETLRARGDRWIVTLREGIDDEWIPVVQALGLIELGPDPWMPGMAAHPLPPPGSVPIPGELEIRRAIDADGIRDHIDAAAAGFEMPREWLETIIGPGTLDIPDAAIYAGYVHGEPVVTGFGYRTADTIGVYNISTIDSGRRKGYGAAMTMRVVDDGVAAGCDVAILQASDMGRPIYERLGFRTVVTYRAWVDAE